MDTNDIDRLLAKGEGEALAAYDDGQPTTELTRNPVDSSWGFICTEHGVHRFGLPEQHARNVEAKHLREDHADPLAITLDLRAAAEYVLRDHDATALNMWRALTGLDRDRALELAVDLATSPEPVVAAVAPF